eukprot:gene9302-19309_t
MFLLFIFASITSATEQSDIKFLQWFQSNGGKLSSIALQQFPNMGRGIVATTKVASNHEIIFVPNNLIISVAEIKASIDPQHLFFAKSFSNDGEIITAYLLYELWRGEQSFWTPYFNVLPKYIPNLSQFTAEELSELQHLEFEKEVRATQEKIQANYYRFISICKSFWPEVTKISLDTYKWVVAVVDSRALRFKGKVHLSPVADMFNYKPHSASRSSQAGEFFLTHHQLQSNGSLIITSDRDCLANEQLFEDYGDNSDQIYLQYHGFVPDINPFRCVDITGPSIHSLSIHHQDLAKGFSFRSPPRRCVDASGLLGDSLESYISMLAFTVDEVKSCTDFVREAKSKKQPWSVISTFCGMDKIAKALDVHRSKSGKSKAKSSALSSRAVQTVQDWIVDTIPRFPTTSEQDEILIQELKLKLNSMFSSTNNETSQQVDVAVTVDGVVQDTTAVNDSHKKQDSTQGGTGNDSDDSDGDSAHIIKTLLAVSYRLHNKNLWMNVCDTYSVAHRCASAMTRSNTNNAIELQLDVEDDGKISPKKTLHEKVQSFNSWFTASCDNCSDILVEEIPGFRLGTVARKNIPAEGVYLRVPTSIIMDSEKAFKDELMRPFLQSLSSRFNRRDDFHELLFFLIHEKYIRRNESKYWEYIALLPESHELDIPLFWTAEQRIHRLFPSLILREVESYAARVDLFYKSGMAIDLISSFFSNKVLSLEHYSWAYAILDSRSIWWNGKRHLVPMLDMINCAEGEVEGDVDGDTSGNGSKSKSKSKSRMRVHSTNLDFTGKYAITQAAKGFESGHQVFENYGQPNHIYFIYHGFSLPDNSHDCVQFNMGLEMSEMKRVDWETELRLGLSSASVLEGPVLVCMKNPVPERAWILLAAKLNVIESLYGSHKLGHPFPEGEVLLKELIRDRIGHYAAVLAIDKRLPENKPVDFHESSHKFLVSEAKTLQRLLNSLETSDSDNI